MLARRIKLIEERKGKPEKGDDILLSVITDGRHAAIDLRFVRSTSENEPENKLNALIANVHRIWLETPRPVHRASTARPTRCPARRQMIFSDLGTEAADESAASPPIAGCATS